MSELVFSSLVWGSLYCIIETPLFS
jgi:hypothetical protein